MKVLMINVVCGIRSTGRICTDLASAIEAQGHEVKIAYGREEVPDKFEKYAVRITNDFDIKLHGVRARLFDGCGFGSKITTKKFIKWVKEYNPDVIHLHNIHGYYINIEILFTYLRTCGKRIIWTLHDCWAFTGHSAYCDAVNCERWITCCHDCPNKKEYPVSFTDRSKRNWERKKKIFNSIPNMTIVTPSHWLAGLVKKSFLAQYPVSVIHNGIDTSQFYPMENDFREFYGIDDKFILLGVATAWDDMKGLPDYLRLADMLNDDYKVVLVGLTKEQKRKLPTNVLGIEKTNSIKELAYIYSAADIFLNLSYCENYPTVNLEAMACGTPVVTYQTGGSPESVFKHDGIVVKRGDFETLTSVIKQCRENSSHKTVHLIKEADFDSRATAKAYLKMMRMGGYWRYKHSFGLVGKKVVLGVAVRWDKRKGLDDLAVLAKELNNDCHIIIVGTLDEQIQRFEKNYTLIERTNNVEDLRMLYSISDYFVNPTYEDNYPTTNLEAICCETPVMTYDTGGSGESARLYGCVVSKGDIKTLIDAVDKNKYIKNIFNFDKENMKEEYMYCYRKRQSN